MKNQFEEFQEEEKNNFERNQYEQYMAIGEENQTEDEIAESIAQIQKQFEKEEFKNQTFTGETSFYVRE